MLVKELIEKLQEVNQDAKVCTITVGNGNEWEYTNEPKVTNNINPFGETVFII